MVDILLIIKAYSTTHYLNALKNLILRLSPTDSKKQELEDEFNRINAGDIGEKMVMETLEQLQLPYEFYIFHNLGLRIESNIQVDILLLTKYYLVIFEVKNIKGTIEFQQNPSQLIRTLPNGIIQGFNSPISQLEEYKYQLKHFLSNHRMEIPVLGTIIFPFSSSFIKHPAEKITILRKNEIKTFLRNIPINRKPLTEGHMKSLKQYFLNNHQEFNPYPLINRYSIQKETISNGVICPRCGTIGMKRFPYYWSCQRCHHKSTHAHESAIYDYLTLIHPTITNKECREFLKVEDINQTNKMLRRMNLEKIGNYKGTKYTLSK
ncbi:nuclease-related domain-containing protein [Rummeliibacillus suwonensis]|uniref:nuclease-related domain-containing protein n=1 Tax=Rummeliibacillus suwonensis TaxID=1306154 RepID=UPI0011B7EF77|nr:nuclease-related domain-containing protein [Rummeliibacillus suwonensis]